jgi:hypothetical protein
MSRRAPKNVPRAWAARIGVLAAYREQYQIADDDPHHPAGPHIESTHADYDAYLHVFRAAAELRQAARGRPWDKIDPTVPARTSDASEASKPQVSRGDAQTQARERHRQTLIPTQRRRIAEAAAEQRRVRHARAHEQPESRHEPSAARPLLRPSEPDVSYGHQPKIRRRLHQEESAGRRSDARADLRGELLPGAVEGWSAHRLAKGLHGLGRVEVPP